MTPARAAAALAAAALVAGCGGHTTTRTVTSATTRVEVLRQAGAKVGGFDPGAIFRQESPGVVTIVSTGLRASNGRAESGLGSGFVVSGAGEMSRISSAPRTTRYAPASEERTIKAALNRRRKSTAPIIPAMK